MNEHRWVAVSRGPDAHGRQWPRRGIAAACLLIAQTLLALLAVRGQFDSYALAPESLYAAMLLASAAFVACAACIVPIGWAHGATKRLRQRKTTYFECRRARPADLAELQRFWAKHFGAATPSITQMRAWQQRNREIFWMVEKVSLLAKTRRLVGGFKIVPLVRDAVAALQHENLNGSSFKPHHIARNAGQACGWYIGDVVAEGFYARGLLLQGLEEFLQRAYRRAVPVFTRPLTANGLRLVDRYRFTAVSPAAHGERGRIYQSGALRRRHGGTRQNALWRFIERAWRGLRHQKRLGLDTPDKDPQPTVPGIA